MNQQIFKQVFKGFVVLVAIALVALGVKRLEKVSWELATKDVVQAANEAPAGPPTFLLWSNDRAILVKVRDGDCILYVLQGTDYTTLNHQVNLSIVTGQGCK